MQIHSVTPMRSFKGVLETEDEWCDFGETTRHIIGRSKKLEISLLRPFIELLGDLDLSQSVRGQRAAYCGLGTPKARCQNCGE